MKRKGEVEWDIMINWIIGVAVLVLMIGLYFLFKDKVVGMASYLKGLFG